MCLTRQAAPSRSRGLRGGTFGAAAHFPNGTGSKLHVCMRFVDSASQPTRYIWSGSISGRADHAAPDLPACNEQLGDGALQTARIVSCENTSETLVIRSDERNVACR